MENTAITQPDVADTVIPDSAQDASLRSMAEAGVFYGRKKSRTHPGMKEYIFATRNGIEIIDLEKTQAALDAAAEAVRACVAGGGLVVFVGTHPGSKERTEAIAKRFKLPYVVTRWLGGTLTNFKIISRRIDHFKKLREDIASGALDKYTKAERLGFQKEFNRLEKFLGGLEHLTRLPDMLITTNIEEHATAVREATRIKIPVVAITGTISNPATIRYSIPANDNGKASIEYLLTVLEGAIEKGMSERKAPEVVGPVKTFEKAPFKRPA